MMRATVPVQKSYASLGLIVGLVAAIAACDAARVAGPPAEVGNVEVVIGATVVQSDSGVAVDGEAVVSHPDNGNALWVDRLERFDFGGFPEFDHPQDTHYSLSWRVMLTHRHPPEQRGDTTVFRFHDHGDVTVADVPMHRLTDPPHVDPGAGIVFENFVRYHLPTFTYAEWRSGGSTTFDHATFHDDLVAGHDLAIRTTGSDDVLPVEATFALRPFARLTGLENGATIDLAGPTPVVDVDHPLVFTFDRPIDPARAFIVLHPMDPARPGLRSALIRPHVTTKRVVIPPYALRQLADPTPAPAPAPFRATTVDIATTEHAVTGHLTDTQPFALPLVQRTQTSVHLYLPHSP